MPVGAVAPGPPAVDGGMYGTCGSTAGGGAVGSGSGTLTSAHGGSTGPALSDGCGGLTGVTPLTRYRAWIVEQARKMGAPLSP